MDLSAGGGGGGFHPSVLIVEADWRTRDQYDLTLSRAGLWVAQAADPELGFAMAVELVPDVVVTGIDRGGSTVTGSLPEQLRAAPRTAAIPLIGLASCRLEDIERRAEFTELLRKPVAPALLLDRVSAVLNKSAALRARSARTCARVPDLLNRSAKVLERSAELMAMRGGVNRQCPVCGRWMDYSDTRMIDGVAWDYFMPCPSRCGLFRYDRSQSVLDRL